MRVRWKRVVINVLLLMLGYVAGWSLVLWRCTAVGSGPCAVVRPELRSTNIEHDTLRMSNNSLMIGVMTSRTNLTTRASAIYSTWGKEAYGAIVFYIGSDDQPESSSGLDTSGWTVRSSEGELDRGRPRGVPMSEQSDLKDNERNVQQESQMTLNNIYAEASSQDEPIQWINDLPVVQLRGVSDLTYPPRDKCFIMLRHMLHNFGDRFDWFIRADDDVYIRYGKLVRYLQSVDSALLWYMGQSGIGIPTERGRLGLTRGKPYCMGGPGVVFSAPTLRVLTHHLGECARDTVTSHEDTELGRCVNQYVDIACTTNFQMKELFYQDYKHSLSMGELPPNLAKALTLHPVKDPRDMYRLDLHFQLQRWQDLHHEAQLLASQLKEVNMITRDSIPNEVKNVHPEGSDRKTTTTWLMIGKDFVQETPSTDKEAILTQLKFKNWKEWFFNHIKMNSEGTFPQQTRRKSTQDGMNDDEHTESLESKTLSDNPVWDYAIFTKSNMIDPSRVHRSRKTIMGKATSMLIAFKDSHRLDDLNVKHIHAKYQAYTLTRGLQHVITVSRGKGYQSFLLSSNLGPLQWGGELVRAPQEQYPGSGAGQSPWPDLYVLVPLYGRHQTYVSFLTHLVSAAAKYPGKVNLRVAVFPDSLQEHKLSMAASHSTSDVTITVIEMRPPFSRARALNRLSRTLAPSSVLILMDVDLIVMDSFLVRVALTVRPGQALFPIFFSQYSPSSVCYGIDRCRIGMLNLSADSGFWRTFSFGIAGLTAGDMWKAGGFNNRIVGWGKEDVDFYDRCLSSGLTIFRVVDPTLIHRYHEKICDPSLPADQLHMCKGSRNSHVGSDSKLTQMVLDLEA